MRAWTILAALLVAARLGDHAPGAPGGPREAGARLRAGIVDVLPSQAPDATLEDLVARQRYVQAFEHSVLALEAAARERGPVLGRQSDRAYGTALRAGRSSPPRNVPTVPWLESVINVRS